MGDDPFSKGSPPITQIRLGKRNRAEGRKGSIDMGKKDRLKNGLDSLFSDNSPAEEASAVGIEKLRISLIEPDRNQPRKSFDEEKLGELAENISRNGLLQPIVVRPASGGRYTIIAGERRWRAARLAGLTELPVIIKEVSDREASELALIENLQREDLDPIEEAAAYRRLADEYSMTQEEIAGAVGKSRAAVANAVRLLKLPEEMQKALSAGEISTGHAKILCGIDDSGKREALFEAAKQGASVRELEMLAQAEPRKPSAKKQPAAAFGNPRDKYLNELCLSFMEEYGFRPEFKRKSGGATTLTFTFKNDEELREFARKAAGRDLTDDRD